MNKGFTLIELLVVVLIIGILSSVALPQYTTAVEKARSTEAVTLLSNIRHAAERYRMQANAWPTSFDELDIEIPDNDTATGAQTKNFTISIVSAADSTNFVAKATRSNSSNAYVISVLAKPDGNAIRCCGTALAADATACATEASGTIGKTCKAITSGHSADGKW